MARLVRMILVNAIYFKGQWSEPFDKKYTKKEPFLLGGGNKSQADMMSRMLVGRYAAFNADGSDFATPHTIEGNKKATYPDEGGFQVAQLPYMGDKLGMVLLVPRDPKGLPALEAKLTGPSLARWLGRLRPRAIQVTMPKFKMETSYSLGDKLQAMGMKLAFDKRQANFHGMSKSRHPDDNLKISQVLHKAFVEVNEEGTEAAAATAVVMNVTPLSFGPLAPPFIPEIRADRPFLFLITEVDSGALLFMGRLNAPN